MSERTLAEASVVYKKGGWSITVDGNMIGRTTSLNDATTLLYANGYKVHTYRRSTTASNKVKFDATVLCFTPKQDD